MSYVNVGSSLSATGVRVLTKKALKEALTVSESAVYFDGTSQMGPQFHGSGEELKEGTRLSVVGPDPYTSRKWYATVERINGKLKVS